MKKDTTFPIKRPNQKKEEVTPTTENIQSAPVTVDVGHARLLEALYHAYDVFEGLNVPFFLTGKTAKQVKNGDMLSGAVATIGIRNLDDSRSNMGILVSLAKFERTDNLIKFTEYPLVCEILEVSDKPYFKSFDSIKYESEVFKLPNPVDQYFIDFNIQ